MQYKYPYQNTRKIMPQVVDNCAQSLISQGYSESEAWAICWARYNDMKDNKKTVVYKNTNQTIILPKENTNILGDNNGS